MTLFELLLLLHILAAALWFGSGLAISAIARHARRHDADRLGAVAVPAGWWAGRAHPAAGLVLLITGIAMVLDAGIGFDQPWVIIALIGLFVLFGIGGGLVGRTSEQLSAGLAASGGAMTAELRSSADDVLRYGMIETAVLVLVIADMVIKPG